jgi:hypothetical protein
MEMFSVVPRVTDAQPTHGTASAAANSNLIIGFFPCPPQPSRNPRLKASSVTPIGLVIVNRTRSA